MLLKIANMRNATRTIFSFTIPLFFLLLTSFSTGNGKTPGNRQPSTPVSGPEYITSFKMNYNDVMENLYKAIPLDRRLVLQFGVTPADAPYLSVYWYVIPGMEDHGAGRLAKPLEAETSDVYVRLDGTNMPVFSNNYISLKRIKTYIRSLPNEKFDHLKFIPQVGTNNYVYFIIKAFGADGKQIDSNPNERVNTVDYESTNPSPPAPPGTGY